MYPLKRISRRSLLRSTIAAGVGLAVPTVAFSKQCDKTPDQPEGPFYMNTWDRTKSVAHHNDLTWVTDPGKMAEGEVIHLSGQVTDLDCKPVNGAMVEIWQACRTGRYAHMADPSTAWLDPNFRYFGEFLTGEDGMYSFKTIKPGPYPVGANWIRPAHVHFKVTAGLKAHILTSQMYFAGDPHLGLDRLLSSVPKAEQKRLVVEPSRRSGANAEDLYTFDIRLVPFKI